MAFPPGFLDELRGRISLSGLIGRSVKLVRRGREYAGLCPFHHEKTPSFYVVEDKSFFHCFGCGAHGDVIGFVMRSDNLDFIEAIEKLAGEAGLAVPQCNPARTRAGAAAKDLARGVRGGRGLLRGVSGVARGNSRAKLSGGTRSRFRDDPALSLGLGSG